MLQDGTALLLCFAAADLPCLINLIEQIASVLYELHASDEVNVGIVCSPKLISACIVIESELQAVLAPDQTNCVASFAAKAVCLDFCAAYKNPFFGLSFNGSFCPF